MVITSRYQQIFNLFWSVVCAAALLFLCSCTIATGQVIGGFTVGVLLDGLASQVKEAEDKAIVGGMILEIGAGGEVSLILQQAKMAYGDSLDKTVSQLNQQDQRVLSSLILVINKFCSCKRETLSDILDEGRGIIDDFFLSKRFPKVYRFTPYFVVGMNDVVAQPFHFKLTGDFVDLSEPGYTPTLKISGRSFNASAISPGNILFELPGDIFHPVDKKITVDFAIIDIPYRSNTPLQQKVNAQYILPTSTLPKNLGTCTITISTPNAGTISHQIVSPVFFQDSSDDDVSGIHKWPATAGWRIIPASVHYKIKWSQGKEGFEKDWWFERNLSTPQEAILMFRTEHHRFSCSGKIHFNIIFTEKKDVLNDDVSTLSIGMEWGTSRVIELPAGATWKGKFTRYDGQVLEFSGPFDNKLVKVSQTGSLINFECIH